MLRFKKLEGLYGLHLLSDSERQTRAAHTKNGGAPWLPEPSMENNDKHSAAQTAQSHRKSARKQHKTPQFLQKHRSDQQIHPLAVEIKRNNPKKRQGEQPDEAP